jgi:hypothetical protein
MYCTTNFKSKKALKEAIATGKQVSVFAPGIGFPPMNGSTCVEGPHYPQPHTWCATVELVGGYIVRVK